MLHIVNATLVVTERKRVGRALRKSRARFRSYFESGSIGMAMA